MTRALIAEFDDADRFLAALKISKAEGLPAFDALTPFHMPQAAELLAGHFPRFGSSWRSAGLGWRSSVTPCNGIAR